ncbi:unnamed protein product, partial [Rotaria sordida]
MLHMDGNSNLNDVWMKVSEDIENILEGREMSSVEYMDLYNEVYNYCAKTQSQGSSTRTPIKSTTKSDGNNRHSTMEDGKKIVGGEFYTKLKTYIKAYLEKICK